MARGRYGNQDPGDQHNTQAWGEHLNDNETVEGPVVKKLQGFAKRGQFHRIENEMELLRQKGWSQSRRDSMLSRIMHGVRLG